MHTYERRESQRSGVTQRSARAAALVRTVARGAGQRIDPAVRAPMERHLGLDFSHVRVHTGRGATDSARAIGASAYTVGSHIVLAGNAGPGSASVQRTIAHELTHVAQQRAGPVDGVLQPGGFRLSQSDDRHERHAEATADRVVGHDGDGAPQAGRPIAAAASSQPAPAFSVQRKVGFELEDNTWESYEGAAPEPQWTHVNPLYQAPRNTNIWARSSASHVNNDLKAFGVKAFAKKDKLHVGTGFNLEADGPYDRGKMDIEFVTEPFDDTIAGYKRMDVAFMGIAKVIGHLNSMSPMPRRAENGEFYRHDEHKLSNSDVLLAKGSSRPSFKMQVTHGVPLADVPALFETFGYAPGESSKQAKQRAPARSLLPEQLDLQKQIMGAAPGQARLVLDGLMNGGVIGDREDTRALVGFLTYALAYIQWLQVLPWDGLKIALPFMSRYDFARLFGMLPAEQQGKLSGDPGRKMLLRAMTAVVAKFGVANGKRTKPVAGETALDQPMMSFEPGVSAMGAKKRQFLTLVETLTTQDWLNGILDRKDLLTGTGIHDYLRASGKGQEADDFEKSFRIFSRGHGATKTLVDAEPDLAIMENRGIAPLASRDLDIVEAHEVARTYMSYIISLRSGETKFPKMSSLAQAQRGERKRTQKRLAEDEKRKQRS